MSSHRLRYLLPLAIVIATAGTICTAAEPASPPVIEIGRKHSIVSNILKEPVDLIVHLPDAYEADDARHPVLFLLGSDYRSRFALAASSLDYMNSQGQIPPIILVGIDLPHGNFGLVPREGAEGTASADRYVAALTEEIIPYVDGRFRTNGYRILYGGSNSGIFAVYALMQGRLPAQAYIASSPMLGWSPQLIADQTKAAFADTTRPDRFLFLIESDDDYDHVTREFPNYIHLLETSAPAWLRWKAEIRTNEGHVPEVDFPLGLRALFPDYNPLTELTTLQALQDHYGKLSQRYGFAIEVPLALLTDLGFTLAFAGDLDQAQRVFESAIEHHPQNAQSHAGLGLVDQKRGDSTAAIPHLRKALECDPGNRLATRVLAEIEAAARTSGAVMPSPSG